MITLAIHTYKRALEVKKLLEAEGIKVSLESVNASDTGLSPGVRIRINDTDLPLALRVIENTDIFAPPSGALSLHPILVPIDGSEMSLQAVAVAASMARMHRRELVILHTYLDPSLAENLQLSDALTLDLSVDAEARRQVEQTAHSMMDMFVAKVKSGMDSGRIARVPFKIMIEEGVPEDSIREYARNNAPYLVVMGTRSVQRKTAEMIGSVTGEVIDKNRCSVLTVPENHDPFTQSGQYNPKNILFLSNLEQEDILAFDTMHRILGDSNANVVISHVSTRRRPFAGNAQDALERLADYCRRNFPCYNISTMLFTGDNTLTSLQNYINTYKIDMAVLPNKRKNVLARFVSPALANRLLATVDVPLLVIRV